MSSIKAHVVIKSEYLPVTIASDAVFTLEATAALFSVICTCSLPLNIFTSAIEYVPALPAELSFKSIRTYFVLTGLKVISCVAPFPFWLTALVASQPFSGSSYTIHCLPWWISQYCTSNFFAYGHSLFAAVPHVITTLSTSFSLSKSKYTHWLFGISVTAFDLQAVVGVVVCHFLCVIKHSVVFH